MKPTPITPRIATAIKTSKRVKPLCLCNHLVFRSIAISRHRLPIFKDAGFDFTFNINEANYLISVKRHR